MFKPPAVQVTTCDLSDGSTCFSASKKTTFVPSSFYAEPSLNARLLKRGQLLPEDLEGKFLPVTCDQNNLSRLTFHLSFEMPRELDHSRLEAAWNSVQRKHVALRSVYVSDNGIMYQAFLRHTQTVIAIESSQQPVQKWVENFCERDGSIAIPDGKPQCQPIRFIDSTNNSVLVVRMNHAQHDLLSKFIIFNDLTVAYRDPGALGAQGLGFARYIEHRLEHDSSADTVEFWKGFLDGSSMTLAPLQNPQLPQGDFYAHSIAVPSSQPPPGITLASVFRAAWALVLSQYVHQNDVVFGEVTSGRNLPLEGLKNLVGCMIATSPSRITIPLDGTVFEFLRYAQEQHFRRKPYETLGLEDIIHQCTSWSTDTQFGTILLFNDPKLAPQLVLEGHLCPHRWFAHGEQEGVFVDLQPGMHEWQIAIYGKGDHVPKDDAKMLLDKLAETLKQLTAMPEGQLSNVRI
ncbi:hypothetical protein BJX99DRAFT_263218 [Aspergillus californicus]